MTIVFISLAILFLVSPCDFLNLITLPDSSLTINCTLNVSCNPPSWKINDKLYSSFSLTNYQTPYSVVDVGNLFFNQIQPEINGTTLTCISVHYTSLLGQFVSTQGLQTTLIVASIPDQTQVPSFSILAGCIIRLVWSAPFDNHKSIKYYTILLVENGTTTVINTTLADTFYLFENISGGLTYTVSIAAVNIVGPGLFSDSLTFSYPINSPRPVCEVSSVTSDSISLTWSLSYDLSEYEEFSIIFKIKYGALNSDFHSLLLNKSSLVLTSLKPDTMYFINITSYIPGFSNCIFNSSCNIIASTNINPTNYAVNLSGNPTSIFIFLYLLFLFVF